MTANHVMRRLLPLLLFFALPASAQNFGNIKPGTVLGNPDRSASKPAVPMPLEMIGAAVTPQQFGAVGDGVADDTGPLQAWGTWVAAAEGRSGYLPPGSYKITAPLIWSGGKNWSLLGAGMNASRIVYSGASTTVDIVKLSSATEVLWQGWGIYSTTVMTGGAAAHFYDVDYSRFVQFTTGQGGKLNDGGPPHPTPTLYDGIRFENTAWDILDHSMPYVTHDAVLINQGVELRINNFINVNQGNAGIHLAGGFGGLYLGYSSVECINVGKYGLLVDNSLTATTNLQIFVSDQAVFDTCLTHNAYINDTVSSGNGIKDLVWAGWAGGAGPTVGAAGLYVKAWSNGTVKVAGSSNLISNQGSGLKIGDATALVSLDTAATLAGNAAWGIECEVATTNIFSAAHLWPSWANVLGKYSPLCGGTLP